MSRSSLGFRRSFNTGRKLSRENRKDGGTPHAQQRRRSEHSELHEKRQRSRHDNSEAEKATRSIFGDVPLTDTERRYLWAAQSGNLPALEMLVEESGTFNLSCRPSIQHQLHHVLHLLELIIAIDSINKPPSP
ncbi:hypothetical protein RRG08_012210 [Elysia crispata]|uniref:Uncharacterized protein n=1 Tax=Elysia crispata TaxID=231223 RepID=A0AAE0ZLF1_9GAST|nr:hypothetical protein RRG08_012210 [Elysia crispata]